MNALLLEKVLASAKNVSLLVIGDLMLDEYLYGTIDRISPEAPVQVVNWREQRSGLGGAANVANNLAQLGCHVFLAGVVGSDATAEELLNTARAMGINTAGVVTDADRPTTLKTRVIAHRQQVIRIDREGGSQISDGSAKALLDRVRKYIPSVDGIILSDYAKGVLRSDFCASVIQAGSSNHKRVLVDPKGDDFRKYRGAFLLTPNKAELGRATQLPVRNEDEIRAAIACLFSQTECEAILVTRSEEGMSLYTRTGSETHIQTEARDVFDITGAGDTVISMIATYVLGPTVFLFDTMVPRIVAAAATLMMLFAYQPTLRYYRLAEIERDRASPSLDAWIESTALRPFKVRLTVLSLLGQAQRRDRIFFAPDRNGAATSVERSAWHPGRWLNLTVSGNF